MAHVQVVDHLGDQVVRILDKGHVGLDIAGDPEAGEDVLAEAVGGDDGRRVEVGERSRETLPAYLDLGPAAGCQPAEHAVVGRGSDTLERQAQSGLGADQSLSDPLA